MPDVPDELGLFRAALDQSEMSREDKSFIRSLLWTGEEVPEISSAAQYQVYANVADGLKRRYSSEREVTLSLDFYRSQPGMLYTALTGRLIEWEEQNTR
jgi:hypothetical protein